MILKIVSGGQTGVDRAALDVAIKLGIPHGGWVPKGRLAEDGPLPETYAVRETSTAVHAERTEKNVIDSDGTLIISRGKISGGSRFTREMATRHGRPWLHVDLNRTAAFRAAVMIAEWLGLHPIRVLNVAGPRASKDPQIYQDTLALLESVLYLDLSTSNLKDSANYSGQQGPGSMQEAPRRVKEAVDRLVGGLPLKDKVTIANMAETELPALAPTLGEFIVTRFGLASGNTTLLRSCRWVAKRPINGEGDAAAIIVRELWKHLRRTHPLRIIK
jgi:Circularly permutated YpsA SLOG family